MYHTIKEDLIFFGVYVTVIGLLPTGWILWSLRKQRSRPMPDQSEVEIHVASPTLIGKHIQTLEGLRNELWSRIEQIAKEHIPDYHFLDHKVSTFWTCDESPIGMCVFKLEERHGRMIMTECRYCGGPVERK